MSDPDKDDPRPTETRLAGMPGPVSVANATIGMAEDDEEEGTNNHFAFVPFESLNEHRGWRPIRELANFTDVNKPYLDCSYDDAMNAKVRKGDGLTYYRINNGYLTHG